MAVSRRDRGTRVLVIGLILTSLFTITLDFRGGDSGPLATLGRVSLDVISPLQEAVSKVFRPLGAFFTDIWHISSIKAENARLEDQLEAIQGDQGLVQQYERELSELRALLDLGAEHALVLKGAEVIAGPVSNFEWTMTIDKGSSDGVELDMPVLAPEGLAGRVVKVGSSSSIVQLVIDPQSGVSVRLSTSGEVALLVGQRDQPLRLDLYDPAATVEPGELVETSGFKEAFGTEDSLFPAGILVGEVSEVIPDESGDDREILVRPVVDFSRLSTVAVVMGATPDADDFLAED